MHAMGLADSPDAVTLALAETENAPSEIVMHSETDPTPATRVYKRVLPAPCELREENKTGWHYLQPQWTPTAVYAREVVRP